MKTSNPRNIAGPATSSARPFFQAEKDQTAHGKSDTNEPSRFFRSSTVGGGSSIESTTVQAKCTECETEESGVKDDTHGVKDDTRETNNIQRKSTFENINENERDFDSESSTELQRMAISKNSLTPSASGTCFPSVQTKLEVGASNDPLEREADKVADQVVNGETQVVQRRCSSCGENSTSERDNHEKPHSDVQRKDAGNATGGSFQSSESLEAKLNSRNGSGNPLPQNVRGEMENGFGADFSDVRLHTDNDAVEMNRSLHSRAFAHGSNIYFDRGALDHGSVSGKRLLAHELTHTIQQGAVEPLGDQNESSFRSADDSGRGQQKLQRQACPASNPPVEQPAEDQEQPEEQEQPKEIETLPGLPVEARQEQSPDPMEFAPEPQDNISTEFEAQAPTAEQLTTDTNADLVESAGFGKTEGESQGLVSEQAATLEEASGVGNAEINPNGMGEAASPEVASERDAMLASETGASNSLVSLCTDIMSTVSGGVQFAAAPSAAGLSESERRSYLARKTRGDSVVTQFMASSATRISEFALHGLERSSVLNSKTEEKKAALASVIEQKRDMALQAMQLLRADALTKQGAARAQLIAKHAASVGQIGTRAGLARSEIELADAQARVEVEKQRLSQVEQLERLYTETDRLYRDVGPEVGKMAVERAEAIAIDYESRKTGTKDGFWDGYLTDNRWQARADAARQTGKQYKEGLIEEASKQAEAAIKGKSRDAEIVELSASKTLKGLDAAKANALEALSTSEQLAVEQASSTLENALQSLEISLRQTLSSIQEQEDSQLQFLMDYGIRQQIAIERDSANAATSIMLGIEDAAGQLAALLDEFKTSVAKTEAPQLDSLNTFVEGLSRSFDASLVNANAKIEVALALSQAGLDDGASLAIQALETYSSSALDNAYNTASAFSTTLGTLVDGTLAGFDVIEQTFGGTATASVDSANAVFADMTIGLATTYVTITSNLTAQFAEKVQQLKTGLTGVLDKDLERVICEQAEKAAAEVQPWWKSALKILLVIVVIVVVALVIGPAVIGAVGAAAGALGASAGVASAIGAVVGGAIVGGFAGGVIQIGNNVIDGKNTFDGVGKAIVVGAIGGALGGAGGALAQGLANAGRLGAAGFMQTSMKFGIEMALDVSGGILGDLAVGNPVTLEGVLVGAAIGGAVSIGSANIGRLGGAGARLNAVQARSTALGEQLGSRAGRSVRGVVTGHGLPSPHSSPGGAEISAPQVSDEPGVPHTTEDFVGPRPTDEPGTTRPSEEPGATRPSEEPTARADDADAPGTETRPTGDVGEVSQRSSSGHDVTVQPDGTIIRCSRCAKLETRYEVELSNPKNSEIAAHLEKVKAMPEGKAKAAAAAEVEAKLSAVRETGEISHKRWDDPNLTKAEMIADYRAENPTSQVTDEQIGAHFDSGERFIPRSGTDPLPANADRNHSATGQDQGNTKSSKPDWLKRLDAGNAFDDAQAHRYPFNEVYVENPQGGYHRLDSYNPRTGEIVSRKFTQLGNIQESSGRAYLNELAAKYAPGARIADVPSSSNLAGQRLRGRMILEVPVQTTEVPQSLLDAANNLGVLIRDVNGRIY